MVADVIRPRFWLELLQIMGINTLLSGDNAVVIALASRSLPDRQRNVAVVGGSSAAIVLRIIFCLVISSLLRIPYLKLVGGLLLLYIGMKLLVPEAEGDGADVSAHSDVWRAIQTILVADAVMSLDNVVAIAAAAHGSVLLITLGLAISIPLIVYGSQLVLRVLNQFPILVVLGSGLLGWIAADIILSDPAVCAYLPCDARVEWVARPMLALLVMGGGTALARRARPATVEPQE